jgi:uncharacterized protein (TIGR02266 family)
MSSESRSSAASSALDDALYLRRSGRIAVAIDVRVTAGARRFKGTAANIGAGGLFLVADRLSPIGEELLLSFRLPDLEDELNVRAEVRWVRGDISSHDEHPLGMGLRFLDVSTGHRLTLSDFVRTIEDRGYRA